MLEGIMQVAIGLALPTRPLAVGPRDQAMRAARTCYDHLAGRLGVAITHALTEARHVELEAEAGLVTPTGIALFRTLGIELAAASSAPGKRRPRILCRPCLDWSERHPHLAGALGAALCRFCLEHSWIRRIPGGRAVEITPHGRQMFRATFGMHDI